ncbi:chlorophyllase-2-like [Homarus americanus]|uniref:Chlorophyllase-1-like n=1 Tax=Homarus americanus TaxID=6706 RepID=A0A8J5ML16_HOMAM|nr:chlorophyllase-2-like [Homarus americanus]KAG7155453.1 Chlorophyllase-1-like [Homarus americanus]
MSVGQADEKDNVAQPILHHLHLYTMILESVLVPLLFVTVCRCGAQEDFKPYERGSHNTASVHIQSLYTLGLQENLDVWLPTDAGTYKVYYFLDGFDGVIPGVAYAQTMDHIASHGVAVVVPWKITASIDPDVRMSLFVSVMNWAENHLEKKLHNSGINDTVHLDLDNLVVGGHSAGAHVQVEYLKSTCGKFKGQVFMSPVDGLTVFCITPGQTLNYIIPTLHLAAGLDNVPGVGGFPCAPDSLSNDRFYDALDPTSQRWSVNATQFGHGGFLDPLYEESLEVLDFCGYNVNATDDEFDAYRRYIAGQIVTFIKALFTEEGDCGQYLPYLEDTSRMIVDTEERHQNPVGGCPVAACTWSPLPNTTAVPPTTTLDVQHL